MSIHSYYKDENIPIKIYDKYNFEEKKELINDNNNNNENELVIKKSKSRKT